MILKKSRSFSITDEALEALKERAKEEGRSLSDTLERLITAATKTEQETK